MDTHNLTMHERDEAILRLRAKGLTFKQIGVETHLTAARCCQIVKRLVAQVQEARA